MHVCMYDNIIICRHACTCVGYVCIYVCMNVYMYIWIFSTSQWGLTRQYSRSVLSNPFDTVHGPWCHRKILKILKIILADVQGNSKVESND